VAGWVNIAQPANKNMIAKPQMGAAEELGGAEPEEQAPESGSFFIPADMLPGKSLKKGESVELTVVGVDDEGDYEVKLANAGGGEDWREDLKTTLNAGEGEMS
jgi:hypothetical protein